MNWLLKVTGRGIIREAQAVYKDGNQIGNTTYVIETEFAGRESLADKLRRMMMGDDEK